MPDTYYTPSTDRLRLDAEAEVMAKDDIASLKTMRSAMLTARDRIAKLHFRGDFPINGHDQASVLALLDELTPECDAAAQQQVFNRMLELVGGV